MRQSIRNSLVAILVIVLMLGLVPAPALAEMIPEEPMTAEQKPTGSAVGDEMSPDSSEAVGSHAGTPSEPGDTTEAPVADSATTSAVLTPRIPPNDPRNIIEREFEFVPVDGPLDVDGNAPSDEPQLQAQQVDEATLRGLIKSTLGNHQTEAVDIESYGITFKEFSSIYRDVVTSTYDFFYVEPSCQIAYYSQTGLVLDFTPWYVNLGAENSEEEYAQFKVNTAEVLSWVPFNASKLEQAKAVHDWFCWNVTYDYASYNSNDFKWCDHNAFGALNKRTCVCQGFAEAYQCIMALLDIPCTIVSANNHAWNRIQIGDNWYHVDTTWDQGFTSVSYQDTMPTSTIWFMKSDDKVAAQDRSYGQKSTHCDFVNNHPATDTTYDDYTDRDWTTYRAPMSPSPVSSFQLSESRLTMSSYEAQTLSLESVSPSQTGIVMAQWTSSDPAVAWVSSTGEVVAGAQAGSATITATLGSVSRTCVVDVKGKLDDAVISDLATQTYDGSQKRPSITVTSAGKTLTEGTDYTVEYANNVNAGTATVTITGKGSYTGSKSATFTILPATITSVAPQTSAFVYDGQAKEPAVTVKAGSANVPASGYDVEYASNINAGTATVTVTGKGNYTGSKSANFQISKAQGSVTAQVTTNTIACAYSVYQKHTFDTSNVTVSGAIGGVNYSNVSTDATAAGFEIDCWTGVATVSKGTPAGTYELRVSIRDDGDDNHTSGNAVATYSVRVDPASVSNATTEEIYARDYTGSEITPRLTVVLGGYVLKRDVDYTVEYKDNINAGTATAIVTGMGNYQGSKSVTFQIGKAQSSLVAKAVTSVVSCSYSPDEDHTFDTPNVSVSGAHGGLTYSNSTLGTTASLFGVENGTGRVTVPKGTPTGTYSLRVCVSDAGDANHASGTAYASYLVRVEPAFMGGAVVSEIPAQAYTGDEVTPRPTVTLGGRPLIEGADYTLAYANNVDVGTATVMVTGKGNYAGSTSANFQIAAPPKAFSDVPEESWYHDVVERATALGLLSGYSNGNFGPNDRITRGQVAVVLWNMANCPAVGDGARDFPDVQANDYFCQAVRWASSKGIVNGYGNGNFGPDDPVTREQLAVMLASYSTQVAGRPASGSAADYADMGDAGSVSGWAVPSVGWCFQKGIISGGGLLRPQGNASRAEAAKMVVLLRDVLA